ncbi:serine protease inhibitor 3/4-like [Arctopsyche grandis]|uniref:serine protease inhibitor 3/4-like n=1 Tax=Arctopsyche grandis TaxID=121162 RepID=UPI00406D68EE
MHLSLLKGLFLAIFFVSFTIVNGQDINQFSTRFYKEIVALSPKDNAICSPLSAQIALGFLSIGARGDTQKELNSALFLPTSGAEVFKPTIAGLQDVKGITLKIANKIYVPDSPGFTLASDFQQKAVDIFNSEVQKINFGDATKAASTINTWVEGKTDSKIKDLVSPTILGPLTNMVLVNAIYFKGTWKTKFDAKLTSMKNFNLNSGNKIKVDTMSHTSSYSYGDIPSLDAAALEMPYAGDEASMVILLPKEIEGLSKLEEKVATTNLKDVVFDALPSPRNVSISIPKFKIETKMDLRSTVLPNLGIKLIFDSSNGDLSGIFSSNQRISVSEVLQKAFIEVNEEGTTAAAATAIVSRGGGAFNIDRPFMFVIKKSTGEILFMGRYGAKIAGPLVTEVPVTRPRPTFPPWWPRLPYRQRSPRYYR